MNAAFMNFVNHKHSISAAVNMCSVVVEFEGFQLNPYDFIIKELAFYVIDYGYHARWNFLPPFPWSELSAKNKKMAAWLTRNFHGLRWESGDLPYSSCELILTSLLTSYKVIYTKGLEKTIFLERKSGRKIFNLDDLNCPKVTSLGSLQVKCPVHMLHFKHCALVKASFYALYIKETTFLPKVICVEDVNHRASQIVDEDKK